MFNERQYKHLLSKTLAIFNFFYYLIDSWYEMANENTVFRTARSI